MTPLVGGLGAGLDLAGDDPRTLVASFVRGLHAAVERNPWLPASGCAKSLPRAARCAPCCHAIAPRVARVLARRFAALRQDGALSAGVDPRLLVVSLVGLTLFPLAAEPIWRRMFDAADIDRAALERHTLALLDHGLGGGAHAR